jgi:hypothetical protein
VTGGLVSRFSSGSAVKKQRGRVLTGDFFNVSCGRHCLFWSCWQRSRRGLSSNGVDFLAKGAAGRAQLLLSPPGSERFFDPRCAAKTLANAHSADQRSAARQEPRSPRSSPVFLQNFRESQCHWPSAGRTAATCHQQPEAFRFVRQASSVRAAWITPAADSGESQKTTVSRFRFRQNCWMDAGSRTDGRGVPAECSCVSGVAH